MKDFYAQLVDGYDQNLNKDGVNGERLAKRFASLAEIGVSEQRFWRPGYSADEKKAKELVKEWMREAGFHVREDGAGNVIGRLEGKNAEAKAIASGSHVDSVPNGGHFDGPLGVLAALEVAEAWRETGYQPEKPYELLIFSDEEGSRFNSGLSGSMAMTGEADLDEFTALTDFNGTSFEQVLTEYGSSLEGYRKAKRDITEELELFVELHIEQGKKLEQEQQPVGIVSGIAGPAWLEVVFTGEAGHAGNTPMRGRKDPLVAAAAFIQRVAELPATISDTAVATVGKLDVSPNGTNVIPQEVKLIVDLRDIHEEPRDQLLEAVRQEANRISKSSGVAAKLSQKTKIKPIPVEEKWQSQLSESLRKFNITPIRIPSGAGHDAMILGRHIAVAMLFARSRDGISHNPREWTSLNDCVTAAHILKDFIEQQQSATAG
ncbi:M20 family metallo-hydrolase [Planococcus lenghuensis]|uniref:Allantoate amidohydrolase n=1 Tax=Planococcus lenghuensis TaxID=2213202 RepID=A0A1Q2L262_9BACL|nr:M20 family metallo-hydrolase [Planococcus lenghuensis]AQQ53972.1 allantoate amidohydrolase [Planococcus lenghuensis]